MPSSKTLTEAQYATLGTYILSQADLADEVAGNADQAIADLLNLDAVPPFVVWRTQVPATDYTGAAGIVWTEVDTLSVGKARIFEWMSGQLTRDIDASDGNVRQGIQDAFGAGTTTRTNLVALGKRNATRAEQVFATGTGTTGTPGFLVWEGRLSYLDVAKSLGRA